MEQKQKPEWEIYGASKEAWNAMTSDERNLTRKYHENEELLQQVESLKKENELLALKLTRSEESYMAQDLLKYKDALTTAHEREKALTEQVEMLKAKYNDLFNSIQQHFQTLIARNYNNIGKLIAYLL